MTARRAALVLLATPLALLSQHCSSSANNGAGFDVSSSSGSGNGGGGNAGGNLGGGGSSSSGDPIVFECDKLDLIFVVDNSGSMREEQDNLASNFPSFVQVLDQAKSKKGNPINYRVAVTTTGRDVKYTQQTPIGPFPMDEKGDNGAFLQKSNCNMPRRWLEKGDPGLANSFSCISKVGTGGPSFEMPLEALRMALNERVSDGTNAGFQRPDALLGVVILTDEDDCSRRDNNFTIGLEDCKSMPEIVPVSDYVSALDNAARGSGRWALSVIAGMGPGKCTSSFGEAVEAHRLKGLVTAAGQNGTSSSICSGDLTTALRTTLANFDGACKRLPPPTPR
jgi:enamine deaminase RidA (YjgF/YER057c/UK114 family)